MIVSAIEACVFPCCVGRAQALAPTDDLGVASPSPSSESSPPTTSSPSPTTPSPSSHAPPKASSDASETSASARSSRPSAIASRPSASPGQPGPPPAPLARAPRSRLTTDHARGGARRTPTRVYDARGRARFRRLHASRVARPPRSYDRESDRPRGSYGYDLSVVPRTTSARPAARIATTSILDPATTSFRPKQALAPIPVERSAHRAPIVLYHIRLSHCGGEGDLRERISALATACWSRMRRDCVRSR